LDVCEAVFASLYWLNHQDHCCESFNIGHEHLTSIEALIKVISEVTHAPIETHDASYTYDELAQLGVDISKAEKIFNWKPKRNLEKMIEDEWRFYQNTLKGNKKMILIYKNAQVD
jgi:UDP-glucose 4-epimerase